MCSNISEINDFLELTKSNPGFWSSSFSTHIKLVILLFFVLAKFENELESVNSSLYFTYQ